ncbi:Aminotran-1-2 domain-containing protein [Aphelenchoides bicaudatus]|nr:Aminotran-1-2 domain-containing protein [Aphelenchoides bicaudatus]
MRCLLHLSLSHLEFRQAEWQSICELCGLEQYSDAIKGNQDQLIIVKFELEHIRCILERSMLLKHAYEIYHVTDSHDEMLKWLDTRPDIIETIDVKTNSWALRIRSIGKRQSVEYSEGLLDTYIQTAKIDTAPVDLKEPDYYLSIIETFSNDELQKVYFVKQIGAGQGNLKEQYSLKNRVYIGNTVMNPELAFLQANLSFIKSGDLVIDPFCGTGGLLLPCAHFGAFVVGSEINYKIGRAIGISSRLGEGDLIRGHHSVETNFKQYGLENQFLSIILADASKKLLWRKGTLFDAIVTDPPYGVREKSRKVGTKKPKYEPVENDTRIKLPGKVKYELSNTYLDLMNFAVEYLKMGGHVSFWFPTVFSENMSDPFTLFDGPNTGRYMLNVGAPPPHLLKRFAKLMTEVTPKRLAQEETPEANGRLLQYGTPCGDPIFLQNLRDFLAAQYQDDVKKENLVQTAGATIGLVVMFTQLFPQHGIVYCEQLSYFLGIEMLQKLGFDCKAVPSQIDGLDLNNLEKQFERDLKNVEVDREAGRYSAACYLVPTYQNPNGTVLSGEKCKRIIQLARKFNVLLFCDDVYNFFHYENEPKKRLFAYDNVNDKDYGQGTVVSNCTFSKILAPALRLGWIEMPVGIREKYWAKSPIMWSGGSMNTYVGGLVAELLKNGQAKEHIEIISKEQKEKMAVTVEILRTSLPKSCKLISEPKGGYFMFIELPKNVDSTEVVKKLREKEIIVMDGKRFLVGSPSESNQVENGIRLSIAYPPVEGLKQALPTLCQTLNELCN